MAARVFLRVGTLISRAKAWCLVALIAATAIPGAGAAPQPAGALGSTTVSLERFDGTDVVADAVRVSQRILPGGEAKVVFLVSSGNAAGSVAAGAAATYLHGAVLFTDGTTFPETLAAELVRLAPERIEIVGDQSAITPEVANLVSSLLPEATVERLTAADGSIVAAADGAGVAAAISHLAYAKHPDVVLLASDREVQNAVLAGGAAAAAGAPLLLLDPNAMPDATSDELRRLEPVNAVIVGPVASVSDGMIAELRRLGITVERVAQPTTDDTAIYLGKRYYAPTTSGAVTLMAGSASADVIAVTPLAVERHAPILVVPSDDMLQDPTRGWLIAAHPTRLIVAGSLSDVMLAQLVGFSDGRLAAPPATPTYPAYDSGYHDPGELLTLLRAAEMAYPNLVHIFSIGKSYEGRDIWAAKVSDNVSVDEDEPEVLIDALHHADEHLGVEQALYLFRTLTDDYASDPYVRHLVNEREIWIVFALNPDGWAYDLSGGKYHFWRKNRQPSGGYIGTDINRNYSYKWGCCGGSSGNPWAWNYRGTKPWSAPEARALRDFVNSRVVGGVQQIKTHVTLHVNDEFILFPSCWTKSSAPPDISPDDLATFKAMAVDMARMNGYVAKRSSAMYVTDGDEIDWLFQAHHIFSFTWELYPTEQVHLTSDVYPHYSIVPAETARNRAPLLYLIDRAGCPYAAAGLEAAHCGAAPAASPSLEFPPV